MYYNFLINQKCYFLSNQVIHPSAHHLSMNVNRHQCKIFKCFKWFLVYIVCRESDRFNEILMSCLHHFFSIFVVLFVISVSWTFGAICPGFRSQGRFPHLHAAIDSKIHLWCDTCWLLDGQHCSRASCQHYRNVALLFFRENFSKDGISVKSQPTTFWRSLLHEWTSVKMSGVVGGTVQWGPSRKSLNV